MAFNFGGGGAAKSTASGGGLFGGGAKPGNTSGGLFGGATNTAGGGGGLFGATNNAAAKPATGGGLFGGGATNNAAAKPATGGGLFGAAGGAQKTGAATGGGLFGSATTTKPTSGGGLFGSTQNTASTGGGGLFGGAAQKSNAPLGGGFGKTNSGGGFQLNSSSSLTTNNTTSMQQAGQHLNSVATESRPQLETLTVEDIVTEWEKRISDHERNFQRTVSEMKDFDNILFRVHNRVMKCSDTVFELKTHCGELKEGLESMEKFQDQVDGDLDLLEQEVKRVIAAGQTSSTTADKARESNYKLAEQVDLEVINMMVQIQEMTKKLNSMEKVSDGQGSDFGQIIKIVDRQQRSLEWLNAKANELEAAMQHADTLVTSQQRKLFVEKSGMR